MQKMEIEMECREAMKDRIEKLKQKELEHREKHVQLLERINSNADVGQGLCLICTNNPKNTVFLPCGHVALCTECMTEYMQQFGTKGCIICRGTSHWHKLYI